MKKIISKVLSFVLIVFCECSSVFGMMPKEFYEEVSRICEMTPGISKEREEVLRYFLHMAKIPWTSKHNMLYWNSKYGYVYKENCDYQGIPYTQLERYTSLGRFLENLKNENGKIVYNGPYENGSYLGTDCSWAVTLAWSEIVDRNFNLNDTHDMFIHLKNGALGEDSGGIVWVGNYKIKGEENSTKEVIENNGEEVIFNAYQSLKPGDVLLKNTCNPITGKFTGHTMMVEYVDPKDEFVLIAEQTGVNNEGVLEGNGVSSWRVDIKMSFKDLYDKGYIPVGNKKLISFDNDKSESKMIFVDDTFNSYANNNINP